MTIPIEFIVKGRPSSVNSTSDKKKAWKKKVYLEAHVALATASLPSSSPTTKNVTVRIFFFPKNNQYLDVDNGIKHTIDGFSPPILANDRTVCRLIAERFTPKPGASLKVAAALAPTLQQAMMIANGHPGGAGSPVPKEIATAIKVEEYAWNNGALW